MSLIQKIKCFFGWHKWVHGGYAIGNKVYGTTGAKWCIACKKSDHKDCEVCKNLFGENK